MKKSLLLLTGSALAALSLQAQVVNQPATIPAIQPIPARIMDELERRGIVGPSKGAEPRDILMDLDAAAEQEKPEEA